MNKNVKNVICVVLLLITCGLVYFTITKVSSDVPSGMNGGGNMNGNMGTPPDKPDGKSDNGNMSEPPSKSDSENDNGSMSEPPSIPNNMNEMPNNMSKSINTKYYIAFALEGFVISFIIVIMIMTKFNSLNFSDIFSSKDKTIIFILSNIILTALLTYGIVFITNKCFLNNNGSGNGNINGNNSNVSYSGVKEITSDEDINDGEYNSSNADENAILISGGKATISDVSVSKAGDSSEGDNTSFYGINSGIVAKDGANVTIKNATINTDANGANGVFSYGGSATTNNSNSDNTTINISDSKITTTKDNSGGIMTTGGGIMNATNLEITTNGTSSAAIRSDRGGGTVNVDSGTYTTNGKGSPSIYSTADITVKNAKLISNVSEGIVIEGKNSVSIDNVELTDNNTTLNGQSTTYKNIFIYQSMSGVSKAGDSSEGDNTSFYGINSGIVAKDGANVTIKNATINTDANGANGVFSYGGSATTNNSNSDNTTINISDSKITTTKDNSGGIMTTGGGIMNATNLEITTNGTSSAAIRSDRGGGTVNVDSGTYTTNGKGSPSIYSTADITVKNAKLISNVSEGIVIEGKNSVSIDNVELTDNNTTLNGQSTTYKNIFIYQSMSGDAAVGNASFTAKNSTITTNKGDTLYVTNTTATINLTNNKIINNDKSGNFLRIQKDSWGSNGSNGGNVTLNLDSQEAIGNIVVDSISSLTMSLKNGSYIEGAINSDNTAKNIVLNIDKDSKIKLTGDMYVSELNNDDVTNSNIDLNGYKLYVNNTQIK